MSLGEETLLAVLVAFIAGVALGRVWRGLRSGRRDPRRKRPSSIHYVLGIDLLASRQFDGAIEELTLAAREDTDATEIYLILGNLLREKGQIERAIQIHQSLLHRPGLGSSERAHALLCLGMDFKRAGFRDRALERFEEVTAIEPDNGYALENLVKIYEEEKDWERAIAAQERLSRLTGRTDSTLAAFLYDQVGQAAWSTSSLDEASRAFEASLRADRRAAAPYLHYGDLLEERGELAEAEGKWLALVRECPAHAHLVFDRLARVREELGRAHEMDSFYQRIVREHEGDWRAHLALARLRRRQGRPEEAFELLLVAVRRNPHALAAHQEVWSFLGDDTGDGRIARYLDEVSRSALFVDPFVCTKCGYRTNGILWRCPHCQEWSSFVEERLEGS